MNEFERRLLFLSLTSKTYKEAHSFMKDLMVAEDRASFVRICREKLPVISQSLESDLHERTVASMALNHTEAMSDEEIISVADQLIDSIYHTVIKQIF